MTRARLPFASILLACAVLASSSAVAGPELMLDVDRLEKSVLLDFQVFHPPAERVPLDATVPVSGNCVLDPSEGCVGGPGVRKLLRFDVLVHNRGDADLVVGNPQDFPDLFVFSPCHGHYHFAQASIYELLDADGGSVASGRKQGFCLEDTLPSSSSTRTGRRYDCDYQGIQVGWADFYPRELDCQWIDVTDLPAGDYTLHVLWNPSHLLPDDDPTDNEALVPVTLEPAASAPPEITRLWRPGAYTTYTAGRTLFVQWQARDDQEVVSQEVWFSPDDGASWEQLVGDLEGSATWFVWSIPSDLRTSHARIRVVARDGETQKGELVSSPFRIRGSARARRIPVRHR